MVIHCENQYEKENVISVLKKNNCKHWDSFLKDGNYIAVYPETPSFTIYKDNITASDDFFYTYQQFMEKYGMTDLKSKVEEAKNKTHMSLHQMSKAIGFNEHYLSAVVKRNRSESTQKKVIALLDDLIQKSQQELTHDFQGKSLHKHIDDAIMVGKDEYNNLNKENLDLKEHNANIFNENSVKDFQINQLKKELDHKTQVAEKHADMRAKAEAELQVADEAIKQQLENVASKLLIIGKLENELKEKDELINLAEQDSEKWQGDYWTVSRENVELINSKRAISIWFAVSILTIVLMAACAVLRFNGVV